MHRDAFPMFAPRHLSDEELALARWMLQHGSPEAPEYLTQLDKVQVVGGCACGCASIDFRVDGMPAPAGGLHILGDYLFGAESEVAGCFIFERNGVLSGIEVYALAADTPTQLPRPNELRPWGPGPA